MSTHEVEELATLVMLAEELQVDYTRLRRWADADRKNHFPRPVERIGGVGFFVRADVDRWIRLWRMTTKGRKGE